MMESWPALARLVWLLAAASLFSANEGIVAHILAKSVWAGDEWIFLDSIGSQFKNRPIPIFSPIFQYSNVPTFQEASCKFLIDRGH